MPTSVTVTILSSSMGWNLCLGLLNSSHFGGFCVLHASFLFLWSGFAKFLAAGKYLSKKPLNSIKGGKRIAFSRIRQKEL